MKILTNVTKMKRNSFNMTPFAFFLIASIPSVSSLVCFYCSEHYLTCETYQRYQSCQNNEDRCYLLRSSDQVMQGCGQSFLAYCNQPGVCHIGDLSNCFGRQCPVRAGAANNHQTKPTLLALLTIAIASKLLLSSL